jgi:hypothetical protein
LELQVRNPPLSRGWRVARAAACALVFAAAFITHCATRSLAELVGFEPAAELRALLGALCVLAIPGVPLSVAVALLGPKLGRATWIAAGLALLTGCGISLAWMRVDEYVFERQVKARGVDQLQSRARWWPNGSSAFVWRPERGLHATD